MSETDSGRALIGSGGVAKLEPHPAWGDPEGQCLLPDTNLVDDGPGLANVIALLGARTITEPPEPPTITFAKQATSRYRVEFEYNEDAVAILKTTVPSAMRRWVADKRRWEVSVDWVGPLACAFIDVGFDVAGLDEATIADWFSWLVVPVPIGAQGHDAYCKGFCAVCTQQPHQPGGAECDRCFHRRLTRQYRVFEALVAEGLASYPQARPPERTSSARTTHAPLLIDQWLTDIPVTKHGYDAAADAVIMAQREEATCPICGRRPSKGAVVHIACRLRILHALQGRSFTKSRREGFEKGLCTVCLARPHRLPRHVTCAHCDELIKAVSAAA
jgi:hypothetical protein